MLQVLLAPHASADAFIAAVEKAVENGSIGSWKLATPERGIVHSGAQLAGAGRISLEVSKKQPRYVLVKLLDSDPEDPNAAFIYSTYMSEALQMLIAHTHSAFQAITYSADRVTPPTLRPYRQPA